MQSSGSDKTKATKMGSLEMRIQLRMVETASNPQLPTFMQDADHEWCDAGLAWTAADWSALAFSWSR